MFEENLNKNDWRNKLDNLSSLPAETFDKNVGWEKLHSRLQPVARNRKRKGFWLAAACIILFIALKWLPLNKKENEVVENSTTKAETGSEKKERPNKIETEIFINPPLVKKETSKPAIRKNKDGFVADPADQPRPDTNMAKINTSNNIINTSPSADTLFTPLMVTTPAKKKLRVVHINELGQPAEEKDRFAHAQKFYEESKVTTGDIISRSPFNTYSSSEHTLKIKLTTNN